MGWGRRPGAPKCSPVPAKGSDACADRQVNVGVRGQSNHTALALRIRADK
jgi:hypothetical protein